MRKLWAVLMATLAFTPAVEAQGWIDPLPGRPGVGVVKVRSDVRVRVVDRMAHVEVEEHFRNDGGGLGEGDYLYPLPGEAVFSNVSLFMGEEELRGETMNAEQARSIYEEIVRRQKDPALIELVGHGLLRARVFPIAPNETRRIILRYSQVLGRAGDALQFRYAAAARNNMLDRPTIGRPRPQVPPDMERTRRREIDAAPMTFRMHVEGAARFRDAFSPTHALDVTRENGEMTVRLRDDLVHDLDVFLPLAESALGLTLAAHRASGEDGYFMLTLSPGEVQATRIARDITVVVDVSGSMSGDKMDQARSALLQLLGTLNERDRVRLIEFNGNVRTFDPDWLSANAQVLARARRWVDDLEPEGGTNIDGALAEAFRLEPGEGRLPVVVFVTDGLPSVGEQNPERIAINVERMRGSARVFAFGVGYDVNTYLLDRLSAAGRGGTQYVQPGENVERALGAMAAKIQHPVLTDLTIAGTPVRLTEIYPEQLPDVFAGEDLILFGRYEEGATGALTLSGRRNGRTESFTTPAAFPRHQTANDYIPRLWAARKLGVLTQRIRLNGADPELVEEVRETALRYGLLSEYTSHLVLEPGAEGMLAQDAMAPPPTASVGQASVQRAERSRRAREARSAPEMAASQKALAEELQVSGEGDLAGGASGRVVAGRMFREQDGVWTDARHRASIRTVDVAPFSGAYFALVARLPELKDYWQEMERVLVTGREVSIRLTDRGATNLSPVEIERIARSFRAKG